MSKVFEKANLFSAFEYSQRRRNQNVGDSLYSKSISGYCFKTNKFTSLNVKSMALSRNFNGQRVIREIVNKRRFSQIPIKAQPNMSADTRPLSYWLNWRFSFCALLILASMVEAANVIWKSEGHVRSEHRGRENLKESPGLLYEDETWSTSLEDIHPAWLLAFRVFAFFILLALLLASVVVCGGGVFCFYTQHFCNFMMVHYAYFDSVLVLNRWTFTLLTFFFGLGSVLSIYGCRKHCRKASGGLEEHISLDSKQGTYAPPTIGEVADASSNKSKHFDLHEAPYHPPIAGPLMYVFQIVYQVTAGAVMLTDLVFWLIIYPFLTPKDQGLNFLTVCMHSINAVFLIGDTILNCMCFPYFRIAYFILWTDAFVIFQWIIHACCVNHWWPYPFLDLSSSYAPLWYLGIGVMLFPCYGIFSLIVKLKDLSLSRLFPDSYRKLR